MGFTLGKDFKLYKSTSALTDSVTADQLTWNEQTNVRDLTRGLSKALTDVTTRGSGGWREQAGTLKEASIDLQILYDPDDSLFQSLRGGFLNDTEVTLAILDGDVSTGGTQGLVANFNVTNFPVNEELEERATVDVTIVPSSQTDWYTVTT